MKMKHAIEKLWNLDQEATIAIFTIGLEDVENTCDAHGISLTQEQKREALRRMAADRDADGLPWRA